MEKKQFEKGKPGKLIKVKKGLWGFHPDPLPPEFPLSWQIAERMAEAERELGVLGGVLDSRSARSYTKIFAMREAQLSLKVDGYNIVCNDFLLSMGADEKEGENKKAQEETSLAVRLTGSFEIGAEKLNEISSGPEFMAFLEYFTFLHSMVFPETAGKGKRAGELREGKPVPSPIIPILENWEPYTPSPVGQMKLSLYSFNKFLKQESSLPAIVESILSYYQFLAIAPFAKKSGIIGRQLFSQLMRDRVFSPLPTICISGYFLKRPKEFESAFFAVVYRADWEKWILFMLDAIAEQAKECVGLIYDMDRERREYDDLLADNRKGESVPALLDCLCEMPVITTSKVAKKLRVTFRAAQLTIDKLLKKGVLIEGTGRKRNRIYIAPKIAMIVGES